MRVLTDDQLMPYQKKGKMKVVDEAAPKVYQAPDKSKASVKPSPAKTITSPPAKDYSNLILQLAQSLIANNNQNTMSLASEIRDNRPIPQVIPKKSWRFDIIRNNDGFIESIKAKAID